MKLEDVVKLDIPCDFSGEDENATDYVRDQIWKLGSNNVETYWGATKFAIVFQDLDVVVKIPFNGFYYGECDDDCDDVYPCFEEYENCHDYCGREADLYDMAEEEGIEMFFAKTEFAGFITKNKTMYYISEKVTPYHDCEIPSSKKKASEGSEKKAVEYGKTVQVSPVWIALAIDFYGEELVKKLIDFINRENITDVSLSNVGFRKDGAPVIYDYSGYYENY